jgi:hypothetical protein
LLQRFQGFAAEADEVRVDGGDGGVEEDVQRDDHQAADSAQLAGNAATVDAEAARLIAAEPTAAAEPAAAAGPGATAAEVEAEVATLLESMELTW